MGLCLCFIFPSSLEAPFLRPLLSASPPVSGQVKACLSISPPSLPAGSPITGLLALLHSAFPGKVLRSLKESPHLPAFCVSETDFRAEAKGPGRVSFHIVCAASVPGSSRGLGSLTLQNASVDCLGLSFCVSVTLHQRNRANGCVCVCDIVCIYTVCVYIYIYIYCITRYSDRGV